MHLGADMVGDQSHNALGVGGRKFFTRIGKPFAQPVDPQTSVGVEHDLDNASVFEPSCDTGPERGPEHARATGESFGFGGVDGHRRPRI